MDPHAHGLSPGLDATLCLPKPYCTTVSTHLFVNLALVPVHLSEGHAVGGWQWLHEPRVLTDLRDGDPAHQHMNIRQTSGESTTISGSCSLVCGG